MDTRLKRIHSWLNELWGSSERNVSPASEDASFRRYFRVLGPGQTSFIVMDAPPDKEDLLPFIDVSARLAEAGLNVPVVEEQNLLDGFLLLTDLGQTPYLEVLSPERVNELYVDAMAALAVLQDVPADGLPAYDEALLRREMSLFSDWFLSRHLELDSAEFAPTLSNVHDLLVQNALAQPQVFVHRDYHSRNLMLAQPNPGILDFQDACVGPITYDLVSLLRDCYVRWPTEQVEVWVGRFFEHQQQRLGSITYATFNQWFDLMGVQRHLKAAGIFARLNYRDGKPHYLPDIPRTLSYVVQVAEKYPSLAGLSALLTKQVLPKMDALS